MAEDRYPIRTLTPAEFPGTLVEIPDAPRELTLRGALPPSGHKLLAVVGSRKHSRYARHAIEHILPSLAGAPVTIVSGLALGIDGIAHRIALTHNINTLAVPGSGLSDSVLYPARHRALAQEILARGGGLLSEFAPDFRATAWAFPQRNRIMAGMADAVLIVEATQRSGTLITARLAADYNKDVCAIPGSIFSENSYGPHMLIRLGATPVTSANDLREVLGLPLEATSVAAPELTKEEQEIYDILAAPHERDELIRKLSCNTEEANARIMLLELRGVIKTDGQTYHR